MSNKEQLSKQIKIIDDSIYKLNRIAEQIKVKSDDVYIMSQQLDKLRDNFENFLEVIPDNFVKDNPLTKIYTRQNQDKLKFLSSMLMITQDIFDKWAEEYNYNFQITFHYERIYK